MSENDKPSLGSKPIFTEEAFKDLDALEEGIEIRAEKTADKEVVTIEASKTWGESFSTAASAWWDRMRGWGVAARARWRPGGER